MFITSKKTTLIYLATIACLTGCTAAQTSTSQITTENSTPTPIEITLSDLPEPYATESASNSRS